MLAGLCCPRGLDDTSPSSYVVIVLVVENVAHEKNDGLVSEILPPMGRGASLRPDVACLVHDGRRAIAGVFDDFAFGDIDNGRSPWLCQGMMPPGSIVSLRKRSWRSLMFEGSFSRSMAASTVSVTPLPALVTGARASALTLSAGHSPATAADKPAIAEPAITPARTKLRPNPRPCVTRLSMLVISLVMPGRRRGRSGIQNQSNGGRMEMPNGS